MAVGVNAGRYLVISDSWYSQMQYIQRMKNLRMKNVKREERGGKKTRRTSHLKRPLDALLSGRPLPSPSSKEASMRRKRMVSGYDDRSGGPG
jgi:hypothetical protein